MNILDSFLIEQKNRGNSPATVNFYRENISLFLNWFCGGVSYCLLYTSPVVAVIVVLIALAAWKLIREFFPWQVI